MCLINELGVQPYSFIHTSFTAIVNVYLDGGSTTGKYGPVNSSFLLPRGGQLSWRDAQLWSWPGHVRASTPWPGVPASGFGCVGDFGDVGAFLPSGSMGSCAGVQRLQLCEIR